MSSDLSPEDLRRIAVEVAERAARYLSEAWCSELTQSVKGDTIRADLEADRLIREAIRARLGRFTVVSEESGLTGQGGYVFVVDPLDGSLNYEHCVRWSSVSVAVAPPESTRLSDVVAGAVAPLWGETLSFAKGYGCYEGDKRVTPRRGESRLIYTYVESVSDAIKVARVFNAIPGAKVRSLGSAALEIALVGLGRGLAYVDLRGKLRNVDAAAAIAFARECGARAVDDKGVDLDVPITGVLPLGNVVVAIDKLDVILKAITSAGSP
ncbi:MAG: inositol monophosphatase family protein [Acidilobus sp.]